MNRPAMIDLLDRIEMKIGSPDKEMTLKQLKNMLGQTYSHVQNVFNKTDLRPAIKRKQGATNYYRESELLTWAAKQWPEKVNALADLTPQERGE